MDTYQTLRQALEDIPFIDGHSHVLHHNIEPAPWEGPHPVLPLTRLLLDFNTRGCFPLSEQEISHMLLGHVSPQEQKARLTAPHTRNKSTYRFLIKGLQELYGLDIWEIKADTWDILAQVLADKVDAGIFSMPLALEIAHDVMHRTAEKLFSIP